MSPVTAVACAASAKATGRAAMMLAFKCLAVQSRFASADQKEGMQACVDKRPPVFNHA